jgi:hypothetical protein
MKKQINQTDYIIVKECFSSNTEEERKKNINEKMLKIIRNTEIKGSI